MNFSIFYFTGTGNSLWVARKLGENLRSQSSGSWVSILPLSSLETTLGLDDQMTVGLVFPVHAWGVPSMIKRSLDLVRGAGSYYAIAVNAGQVANTLVQLFREMRKKGMILSAGFSIRMPSNYLPFGGAESVEDQRICFREAEEKLNRVARVMIDRSSLPVEKGPLWQNLLLSGFNGFFSSHASSMDKYFIVQDSCTSCGWCERICPVGNIRLENGSPIWLNHCEQCYACIQWCPAEAIQYGKRTMGKKRYHHPEITLQDMERPQT
ncbi:MAG: EFR1 family ferrodoxin [Spirochaetes bacterium]|nr:EFR1 family ferrodoxin [Spirochaetota bacterium]